MRRKYQSVVVGVGHDQGTHQTGRYPPGSSPYVFQLVFLVDELHVERFGKVLPKEVRCTALQRLSVLHHGLDGVGVEGTGESFVGRLHTFDDGNSHVLLGEVAVDVQHSYGFFLSLFAGGVGRVSFLPQEFGCTQEQARTHLPAEYVGPLVAQDGQVAVGVDPVLVRIPDDGFRCGTDDEFFFQLGSRVYHYSTPVRIVFQTVVCYYCTFFGEAFHVFGLAAKE